MAEPIAIYSFLRRRRAGKKHAKLPSRSKSNVEGSGTTALLPPRLTPPIAELPESDAIADPETLEPPARGLDELSVPDANETLEAREPARAKPPEVANGLPLASEAPIVTKPA